MCCHLSLGKFGTFFLVVLNWIYIILKVRVEFIERFVVGSLKKNHKYAFAAALATQKKEQILKF